jgi:hypothetical protein
MSLGIGSSLAVAVLLIVAHEIRKSDTKILDLLESVEIHVIDMLIRLLTRKSLKIDKSEQCWPREQNA